MNGKHYKLRFLPLFEDDLSGIVDYIAYRLKNPIAADQLVDAVQEAIRERTTCAEAFEPYHSAKERQYPYYRIYVKNFVDNSVERQFLNCQKDNSGTVNKTLQELSKAQGNNTDIKDTDYSDTDPILSSDFSGRDVEKDEEFQSYYQYFYEELEMDYLFREFPYDKEVLESILEILVETVCSKPRFQKPLFVHKNEECCWSFHFGSTEIFGYVYEVPLYG